jgi:glycolate oxidase iron-sulfur subunit
MLKDYAEVLHHHHVDTSEFDDLLDKICDISELFDADQLVAKRPGFSANNASVAYHAPCTLNHGHRMADKLYQQLSKLGYQLLKPRDAHLCCGSAGTYSVLQADISRQLRDDKLGKLLTEFPEKVITANVGCEHHLNGATETPVIHWIEMVADDLID